MEMVEFSGKNYRIHISNRRKITQGCRIREKKLGKKPRLRAYLLFGSLQVTCYLFGFPEIPTRGMQLKLEPEKSELPTLQKICHLSLIMHYGMSNESPLRGYAILPIKKELRSGKCDTMDMQQELMLRIRMEYSTILLAVMLCFCSCGLLCLAVTFSLFLV